MERLYRCILILTTLSLPAAAQHAGHGATPPAGRTGAMSMAMEPFAGMPPSREGSGTGWQPDATPVFGHHTMPGDWMLMAHYNVFLGYDDQSGPRGDEQFNSVNWLMLMAQRGLSPGRLMLRGMFSLEPWTTSAEGYPLLFQSGEAYHGEALIDRQHPHDFFMELSALYRHPLAEDTSAFLYLAPAGEPALGPTAFPHRASATVNPSAPISHHWLDSTHIAFGVATVGISKNKWQLEGSWFNGREPDEDRWDIEAPHLDSYAGRLSYNPSPNWSLQVSHAFLESPEELHPDESVRRTTASVQYYRPLGGEAGLATTLAWGLNDLEGQHPRVSGRGRLAHGGPHDAVWSRGIHREDRRGARSAAGRG